jgi:RND family efflux transporter MFP subunit
MFMKTEMDEEPQMEDVQVEVSRPPARRSNSRHVARNILILLFAIAVIGAVVVSGILPRLRARQTLRVETLDLAKRRVLIVHPKRAAASQELVLPANIQAYTEAPIYARTNGYLKRWTADIGTRVKAGELLAEIDTPELNQQIQQSRADVATAEANLRLAEITAARYDDLLKTNSVSQQETDNARGNLDARRTAAESARFNVKRLEELLAFNKIYAPFDGVITARNTDVGALVDAGSGSGPARELFHIAAIQKLRVYINVPQAYSLAAKPGLPVQITVAEFPGRSFQGTLVRTSNALDASARTLLTEVDMDNPGALLPGAYGEAHLKLPSATPAYQLPVSTLLFRSEGLRVAAVVGEKLVLKKVTLGRDFGNDVEIISGIDDTDQVVVNPSDSLATGQKVEIVQPENQETAK